MSFRSRQLLTYLLPAILAFALYSFLSPAVPHLSPEATSINRLTMSLSSKLSITDVELKGEKVLIRVDFNVP
jgi:phosphoglycerate kinase